MAKALVKAYANRDAIVEQVRVILKEQERDEHGRFGSGSGGGSDRFPTPSNGGPPTGSHMEQRAKELPADTKATAKEAKAIGESAKTWAPKEVGDRMATHYKLTGEHEKAATLHEQLKGYAERAGNTKLAAAHQAAADAHDKAATLHSYAVRDLKNASGRATDGFGGANYSGRAMAAAKVSGDAARASAAASKA